LILLGGLTSGLSFSIIMVLAQSLLPGGKGLASGFTMGFMFASGAVGNVINGWLADWFGLSISLQSVALVALGAAACARFLPRTRPAETAPNVL
jgi:MFS family permease